MSGAGSVFVALENDKARCVNTAFSSSLENQSKGPAILACGIKLAAPKKPNFFNMFLLPLYTLSSVTIFSLIVDDVGVLITSDDGGFIDRF